LKAMSVLAWEQAFATMLYPGEGRGPGLSKAELCGLPPWTPAFAGAHITVVSVRSFLRLVIPGLTRDPAF